MKDHHSLWLALLMQPCLKMGKLALDTHDASIDIYHRLGLKKLRKGVLGKPQFLRLLSSHLEDSVNKNEMLQNTGEIKDVLTSFHGSRVPPVGIQQYVQRIFKYAGCSSACFIVAYIYVDRYLQQTEGYLTSLNVHRLLITSLMVAAKFMDDLFFNNAYYAKVGGVSTSEINRLEIKLLFTIDFRLQVDLETFRRYCLQLEKAGGGYQVDQPIKVCWIKDTWPGKDNSPCDTPIGR